jgi:hypothetical protein
VTDHDDSHGTIRCVPLSELAVGARIAYYAVKLLKLLKTTPPPP